MRLALFAVFLIAEVALAQAPDAKEAPKAKAEDGWKNQSVMAKDGVVAFTKFERFDENGDPVNSVVLVGDPTYLVRDEKDGQVHLRSSTGLDAWLDKDAFVLVKEAPAYFTKIIDDNPDSGAAYELRAHAYRRNGKLDEAVRDLTEAIRLLPQLAPPLLANRAAMHFEKKDYDTALKDIDEALRQKPNEPTYLLSRSLVRMRKVDYSGAVKDVEEAVKQDEKNAIAHNQLAWLLATCPDADVRDGRRAVKHAEKAVEMTERKVGGILDTLAAAYAEAGRFDDAVRTQQEAVNDREFLLTNGNAVTERIDLYRQKKAYREK
jgi:tetratricopeptide (TPR) repeat protein